MGKTLKKLKRKAKNDQDHSPAIPEKTCFLRELLSIPDDQVLNRIMDQDNPTDLVQQIAREDFYLLIKRVGEDDCLPLLKIASDTQRQYLLDLEIWNKDLPDLEKASVWLKRLYMADQERLSRWFFSEGEAFIYYYLFKNIKVEARYGDIDPDLAASFFSIDGVFYLSITDDSLRQTIEEILRAMASVDFERYQYLMSTLAGVIPAEMEEDMYRMRNVRLAEHGFLPPEEAIVVFSPLKPEALIDDSASQKTVYPHDEGLREIIPVFPYNYASSENILTKAFLDLDDDLFKDRFSIEFAGLCNQILSAEGFQANDLDILIGVCKKAGAHLNLALERLCTGDVFLAKKYLMNRSLVSIFRVGFGLALGLRWETERWYKKSWFHDQGLGLGFWGDQWAGILSGILMIKPLLYACLEGKEEYRSFEHLSEIDQCRRIIDGIKALDRLLWRLTGLYPLKRGLKDQTGLTFHQLLFNLWARRLLNLEPNLAGLSSEQIKELFLHLRAGEDSPPHSMTGFEKIFITDMMSYASGFDPMTLERLTEALSLVWKEFSAEYEWVPSQDLDTRFTKFITIEQDVKDMH
ncbi:conserved hypothetical protein [uncultured Desulfobacterium sp.]|uniref:Uncharacterized protein n=1 Tax=uncultured Desulfobacterium sp. TaxID=201089 RepID=A0A445N0D5_9BACT|nr:conserved hypothetical protein [uncultured Desulfobacterium sp.]